MGMLPATALSGTFYLKYLPSVKIVLSRDVVMLLFATLHSRSGWACMRHGGHAQAAPGGGARRGWMAPTWEARRGRRSSQSRPTLSACAVASDDDGGLDVEELLTKARNLVTTSNLLIPYDEGKVSMALVIW
jgi:hypothetical protein